MSDTLTINQNDDTPRRQPRRDRADRQASYERDTPSGPVIETSDHPSPEALIADSARQLQEKDREVAEQRRLAREAQQQAAAALAQADQARRSQFSDRQAVVAQAMESAKAEQTAARATIRAAREAGDVDAEMAAVEGLSAATFRFTQASSELEALKAATPTPVAQQPAQRPQQPQISARAKQWLDDHPRYETDKPYKAMAQFAHNEAVQMGYGTDSQEYIDHIERLLTEQFGENHGHTPQTRSSHVPPSDRSSSSVPPSRGGGGGPNAGGYLPVKTALHRDPIYVRRDRDGNISNIRFSSAEQGKDFREGAETCRMDLADYVLDHIRVADEIASGGTGDLVRGDGQRFE